MTGKVNSMELPVTDEQVSRWHAGELIQVVFSNLSADEREFIKTSLSREEWDSLYKED
jgi:uncharacterized phage-associated protein